MRTRLTELLGIKRPIIQGGLAYLARANLASAVSEAGGLGQITATTCDSVGDLRREIEHVRERTSQPFGVNFAIGQRPIDQLLAEALSLQVPVVSLTGGNPAPYMDKILHSGASVMVLVASVRAAEKAVSLGAHVIIGVGVEGGGHLGRDDVGTMVLTRRLVQAVDVPVVASGGIGDGAQLLAALSLGAEGIEMGTRFVATKECGAHERYKEALMTHDIHQTVIIERSIGRPGRTLPSRHVETILAKEREAGTIDELLPYIRGAVNHRSAVLGQLDEGFVWAGQVTGLIKDVPSVEELLSRMESEARSAYEVMGETFGKNAEE